MNHLINYEGEFAGWKQKPRERLLNDLGRIVVDTVVWNFASTVVLDDWNNANEEYELAESDFQPYALAGWSCVQRTLDWCKDHMYEPPPFIFGTRRQTSTQFIKASRERFWRYYSDGAEKTRQKETERAACNSITIRRLRGVANPKFDADVSKRIASTVRSKKCVGALALGYVQ